MFSKHKEGIPSKMIDLDIRECKPLDLETDCNTTKAKAYYAFSVLIVMAMAIFWCYQKKGMFLDEIYSYGLSNGFFTPFLKTIKQDDIINTIFSRKELFDYLTVSGNDAFSYKSVFYNQMQDVHPPLFYVLLHTISSMMPGVFSKWTGLGLNLLYFLVTIIFIGKLSKKLFNNNYISGIMIVLYGCTSYALSNVVFIRMYMLSTMFTVILAWIILRILAEDQWLNYFLSGIIVCAGLLSHYFFVFYAFFISAFLVLYLLYKKEYIKAIKSSVFLILGVVAFVAIFPTCLQHMTTRTGTGTTAAEYIASFSLGRVFGVTYGLAAGYIFPVIVGMVLLVFLVINRKKIINNIQLNNTLREGVILIVPAIMSFFAITLVSSSSRYVANIAPFFVFIVGYLINAFTIMVKNKRIKIGGLIVTTILSLCFSMYFQPGYLYSDYEKYDQMIQECKDYSCIYITTNRNPSITQDAPQLLHFDNVIVVEDEKSSFIESNIEKIREKDGLVVFFASYPEPLFNKKIISNIAEKTGYSSSKFLYSNGWSDVYKLTTGD